MRLLIDAHALLWAVDDPARLSGPATKALQDPANQLLIGAGTVWEISIKVGLGKLTLSLPYRQWMDRVFIDLGLSILPITVEYYPGTKVRQAFQPDKAAPSGWKA